MTSLFRPFHYRMLSLLIVSSILFWSSCRHERISLVEDPFAQPFVITDTCSTDSIYFNEQILPILVAACATEGCHDPRTSEDNITIISYETLTEQSRMIRSNVDRSLAFRVISSTDTSDVMPPPPYPPLDTQQIDLIRRWIEQGGNNNSCDLPCDTTDIPTYTVEISSIIKNACLGCHNDIQADGGIDYSTFAGIKSTIDDGSFWASIIHESGTSPMPKFIKLPECEIRLIKKWLDAGALNN